MLTQPQITQSLDQIKTLSQQNITDLLYLQQNYSLTQPLHQYLLDRMQILQDVLNIATSSLLCVQDLKQQLEGAETQMKEMRDDMASLCGINLELQQRVEDLLGELREQREELGEIGRKRQILEMEKSIIRRELECTKSQLEREKDEDGKEVVPIPVEKFNVSVNTSFKKQKQQTQSEPQPHPQKPDMTSFRKQISQLLGTTNFLKKKASVAFDSTKKSKQSKSIKSLNSLSFLSSNLPRLKIIKKMSQQSLQNISMGMSSKMMQGSSSGTGKGTEKRTGPVKLAQELEELNLVPCESVYEIPSGLEENIGNATKETEDSICYQYQPSNFIKQASKKPKKVLINPQTNPQPQYQPHPQPSKRFIRSSLDRSTSIDSQLITKIDKRICCQIMDKIQEIHRFCFRKIVRDRIQPRRSIMRKRGF